MTLAVDLTNLRSMTGGDANLEKQLFDQFYDEFETGLQFLENYIQENNAEEWRRKSHALKGLALNLGAADLSSLCKKAQETYQSENALKIALLKNIRSEYDVVRQFLQHTR